LVGEQDDKIRMQLNRRDRLNNLVRTSKGVLERSANNNLDRVNINIDVLSPGSQTRSKINS